VGFGSLGEDFPDFTFVLVTWACLRASVAFSTGLAALLPVLSSIVLSFSGTSVTDLGAGSAGVGRVALTTRPPRTTWFQPDQRLFCSADGCGVTTLFAAGWTAAPLVRLRWLGTCFACAAFASFHLLHPR
jgi:hypothetical protein